MRVSAARRAKAVCHSHVALSTILVRAGGFCEEHCQKRSAVSLGRVPNQGCLQNRCHGVVWTGCLLFWFTLKCLFKLVLSCSILSSGPLLAFLACADNRAPANNVQGHRSCNHHGMPWQSIGSIRLKNLDMLLSRKPFSFLHWTTLPYTQIFKVHNDQVNEAHMARFLPLPTPFTRRDGGIVAPRVGLSNSLQNTQGVFPLFLKLTWLTLSSLSL